MYLNSETYAALLSAQPSFAGAVGVVPVREIQPEEMAAALNKLGVPALLQRGQAGECTIGCKVSQTAWHVRLQKDGMLSIKSQYADMNMTLKKPSVWKYLWDLSSGMDVYPLPMALPSGDQAVLFYGVDNMYKWHMKVTSGIDRAQIVSELLYAVAQADDTVKMTKVSQASDYQKPSRACLHRDSGVCDKALWLG